MNISVFGPLIFEEKSCGDAPNSTPGMPQEEDALTAALNIQVPSTRKSMVILRDFP